MRRIFINTISFLLLFFLFGCALNSQEEKPLEHGSRSLNDISYIMLHDTELPGGIDDVLAFWNKEGNENAAHYVIDRDGTVINVIPIDKIAYHAGLAKEGMADMYGVSMFDTEKSDQVDSGMNTASIGIELCHVSGEEYTEERLSSLSSLIEEINEEIGHKTELIEHKAWNPEKKDPDSELIDYITQFSMNTNEYQGDDK